MTRRPLLAVFVVFCATVAQAQIGSEEGDLTGTRPNVGGEPDEITVRLGVLDISEINDREQLFMADIYVEIGWQDPRLAAQRSGDVDLRTVSIEDIWNPRLTVINDRGLDFLLPETATVDRRGNVIVRQRLVGPLAVDLELHEFPFDTQRLPIDLVSYQYTATEIVFSRQSELVAQVDDMSGDGWKFSALVPEPFVYRLGDDDPGGFGISFAVTAKRESAYYIFTLALPMTLILFLAWMTHWLPADINAPRMGTASASVFSLIAFGVSFRLTLPRITYLTDADRFVLYSTLLVLASLAVAVVTIRWASTDRKEAAERLTRQARLAFPMLYGIIILLTTAA